MQNKKFRMWEKISIIFTILSIVFLISLVALNIAEQPRPTTFIYQGDD